MAFAADMAQPDLLLGPTPGPCAAAAEGPDYVPGVDATGNAVVRADLGAEHIPVPGDIAVPLANRRGRAPAYVNLDGKKLDALLNPPPCGR